MKLPASARIGLATALMASAATLALPAAAQNMAPVRATSPRWRALRIRHGHHGKPGRAHLRQLSSPVERDAPSRSPN